MRFLHGLLAALALIASAATSPAVAQTPKPAALADMQALAKDLQTRCEAWLKDEKEDVTLDDRIKATVYTADSLDDLKQATEKAAVLKSPANVYVITGLMQPLARSDAQTVRRGLAAFRPLYSRLRAYKPLPPQMEEKRAEAIFGVPDISPSAPAAAKLKVLAELDKRRLDKRAAEMPIAKLDAAVGEMQRLYFNLQAAAQDPKEDLDLLKQAVEYESQRNYAFVEALQALDSAIKAKKMSAERAKALYPLAMQTGEAKRWADESYVDYSDAFVNLSGASKFNEKGGLPGNLFFALAADLAPVAGMAAVNVPTREEILNRNWNLRQQGKLPWTTPPKTQPPPPGAGR